MAALNFICVLRKGGDFDEQYVHILRHHVQRNTSSCHQFICLNDVHPTPIFKDGILWLPLLTDYPGRWAKIELFRPNLKLYHPWIFLDLDTAIVGDLSSMIRTLLDANKFAMLHDFYKPERPASGVMYFPEGIRVENVWNNFNSNPKAAMAPSGKWQDDGKFIYESLYPEMILQNEFPGQILTYKPLLAPGKPGRLSEVPKDARMICFHGNPRPHQAAKEMEWVEGYWKSLREPPRLSDYPHTHSGTLVIVGSGPTWKDDWTRVKKIRKGFKVMTIGHAAGFVKADFLVSDHYEIHEELVRLQVPFHGKDVQNFTNHCTVCGAAKANLYIDHCWYWPRAKATSLETAVRIGMAMEFDEIIVCGCPLEAAKIQHPDQVRKDGEQWPPPNKSKERSGEEELKMFRHEFCKLVPSWKGRVFSMSGFTGRLLGEPV